MEGTPHFVLVNEAGDHLALDFDERYEVRDALGTLSMKEEKTETPMIMWTKSLLVMGDEYAMDGKRGMVVAHAHATDGDKQWAFRIGPADFSFIVQRVSHPHPHGFRDPKENHILLTTETFSNGQRNWSQADWTTRLWGNGCGAIAIDGRMVVAMNDQRFLVYERKLRGTDMRHPIPAAEAKLGFVPDDISIVEDGAAILSGGPAGPRELHLVDLQGHEQWKAIVAFPVEAPPIDGADGRVYVVGRGIAAFENGKTLWSQPSSASVHATSLADGSLLVAVGAELRVVARDGTIKQTLKVPEGDTLVAPPAVTAEGVVWLATAKGLYVAR